METKEAQESIRRLCHGMTVLRMTVDDPRRSVILLLTFVWQLIGFLSATPAQALTEQWQRDFRSAYEAQFDAASEIDNLQACIRAERPRVDNLRSEYEAIYNNRERLLEDFAKARKTYNEIEQALHVFNSSPKTIPVDDAQRYTLWYRGQQYQALLDLGYSIYEQADARSRMATVRGKLSHARSVYDRHRAVRARLRECERRLPAAKRSFRAARDRYRGFAQAVVPQNNADLVALTARARDMAAAAASCQPESCSSESCSAARGRMRALADAEVYLLHMRDVLAGLRELVINARDQRYELIKDKIDEEMKVARIEYAQTWLIDFGSMILDVESTMRNLRDASELLDPKKHPAEVFDAVFEAAKDAESLYTAIDGYLEDGLAYDGPLAQFQKIVGDNAHLDSQSIGPEIFGIAPQPAEIATLKSHLSDLYGLQKEFRELKGTASPDWTNFEATFGQLIGRIAKDYANASLAETRDRLNELHAVIDAEIASMAPLADDILAVARRQAALRNALGAIAAARGLQLGCMHAGCQKDPIDAQALPDALLHPEGQRSLGPFSVPKATALKYINSVIPTLLMPAGADAAPVDHRRGDCRDPRSVGNAPGGPFRNAVGGNRTATCKNGGMTGVMRCGVAKPIEEAGGD